ncbi:DUF3021 domain-containing protein [uncultured Lactobacillus sp.]|uniref:DUF3021 domain-containing protein n=1 Tax=uncultured Lactobacillus sp. TaxID=153152 RepID=UPI0028045351|nr:DUF3021 domain-containing protein [uncultured Lactobacillus sp.]
MKKFVKDFALRGLIAAGFGPLILVSVYLGLQLSGTATSIPISQVNLNIVSSLVLAFIAGGISAIFKVERIPLGTATLIDAVVIYLDYLVIYIINDWIKTQFTPLLIFTIIYIIGYLIIWFVIYRQIQKQVTAINKKL